MISYLVFTFLFLFLFWSNSNFTTIENFFTLKNKSLNLDFSEMFSILTSNVVSKFPDFIKPWGEGTSNIIGFPVKTNITARYNNRLSIVEYIIDETLTKLNTASSASSDSSNSSAFSYKWKLLEIIKFNIKLISNEKTRYYIELFLVYSGIPIHVIIDLNYSEIFDKIHYNQVIIMNKIKDFKNAFDPVMKKEFQINNSLGLLPPFKSSDNSIL
jgi:hypothetical protein